MAIDIDRICTMYQQTWPPRRTHDVRHTDGNVNLLDATHTALHVSVWSAWSNAPPSRRARWRPRLWRFKGANADPGALQGGMVETTFVPAWGDVHRGSVASRWRDRVAWRNKSRMADIVHTVATIGPDFPTWIPLTGPRHLQWWARIGAWKSLLASHASQQHRPQTPTQAAETPAFGNINYTGGSMRL